MSEFYLKGSYRLSMHVRNADNKEIFPMIPSYFEITILAKLGLIIIIAPSQQ